MLNFEQVVRNSHVQYILVPCAMYILQRTVQYIHQAIKSSGKNNKQKKHNERIIVSNLLRSISSIYYLFIHTKLYIIYSFFLAILSRFVVVGLQVTIATPTHTHTHMFPHSFCAKNCSSFIWIFNFNVIFDYFFCLCLFFRHRVSPAWTYRMLECVNRACIICKFVAQHIGF